MAIEWPNIVWLGHEQALGEAADSWAWGDEDEPARHDVENPDVGIYLHRDAARAWQAFRDWCDGTAEQWQELLESEQAVRGDAYWAGYDDGQAVGEDRR